MELTTAKDVQKGNILVVDDDPLLTRTLKKVLAHEGYFVDVANDGIEGIKKAKSGYFHLVLCDIRMPGLDGLMTIRHIKEFQEKAGAGHSGFIVITAYDSPESRKQAFQLGVADFFQKPFDLPKFLENISRQMEPLIRKTPFDEVSELNKRLKRLLAAVGQS